MLLLKISIYNKSLFLLWFIINQTCVTAVSSKDLPFYWNRCAVKWLMIFGFLLYFSALSHPYFTNSSPFVSLFLWFFFSFLIFITMGDWKIHRQLKWFQYVVEWYRQRSLPSTLKKTCIHLTFSWLLLSHFLLAIVSIWTLTLETMGYALVHFLLIVCCDFSFPLNKNDFY